MISVSIDIKTELNRWFFPSLAGGAVVLIVGRFSLNTNQTYAAAMSIFVIIISFLSMRSLIRTFTYKFFMAVFILLHISVVFLIKSDFNHVPFTIFTPIAFMDAYVIFRFVGYACKVFDGISVDFN